MTREIKRLRLCLLMIVITVLCLSANTLQAQAATKKFNVSKAKQISALKGYSVKIQINGKTQRFAIKPSEINKYSVTSRTYTSANKKNVTVKANAYINRTVATVKVPVILKYQLKGSKWKLKSVTTKQAKISAIHLKGTWKGSYTANQGLTNTTVVIDIHTKDEYADGTFYFYAAPTNPGVPSGSYSITGGTDKASGTVKLVGDEWISRPSGYNMVDITGCLDLKNKAIKGTVAGRYNRRSDFTINIKKINN